jgi:hypothetical protein
VEATGDERTDCVSGRRRAFCLAAWVKLLHYTDPGQKQDILTFQGRVIFYHPRALGWHTVSFPLRIICFNDR